jgi:putative colanic acid biosynthesis UDP-glucose lipid carrier transferase
LNKRYSIYIKPISIIANLAIINLTLYFGLGDVYFNLLFILYINLTWLIVSYHLEFYNFNRFHKNADIFSQLLLQIIIFTFIYFAFFTLIKQTVDVSYHLQLLAIIFISIGIFRSIYLFALQKYRARGGNFRNIIVIGNNKTTRKIIRYINDHPELGYNILGYFSDKQENNGSFLGKVDDSFDFIRKNVVDQIYCSIEDLSRKQIDSFVQFADNNLKVLKLLPDAKDAYTTKTEIEYFDYIPVLSMRKIPIDDSINQFLKRSFDIVFSLFMIIFVLSWLTPLMYVLVKLESKGPLFFKQKRDGLNGERFVCYKFRSMYVNDDSEKIQAVKGDNRVTKTGHFLRKTSIDELPQFFNVLVGDMSVVGPRPHMLSQTEKYSKLVDKFMVRHFVKPGITGLAQVRGFRGEIRTNIEMGKRIKLDIYYIENWSFFLDLKIIAQTIINIFKGEEKAY